MDDQFEAVFQESISEEDSTKFKQMFRKTEAKPWWIEADEESDDDTGKGHNFLKSHSAGPTHSTPDDSKKKPAENENLNLSLAPKETSNKVERLSSRYAKIGEISNNQRGIRKFEGTLSKDSLEDISEKSEEDSESKRVRMQKKTLVSTETTSQMTASLIQTNKQPQDTGSLPLFKDNSHPGQDTLEEMMDKQKFFFDLEQNASGTLDYGLLNQQLSNTASVININVAAQGEHSPTLNSANSKEPTEITPNQQKPSLLSKVSLKDSQGSSLNTTGISTQADAEHSPVVSKEHIKDTFKDTEFVLIEKDNSGTITSQEMEDLHTALQNIDMSPALPPNELPLLGYDIKRILKPAETETKLPDKTEISENDDCVADSYNNKPTSNQLFKNSKPEIAARSNNQDNNSEMNKTNTRRIQYLENEVEFWKNKYEEEKQQLLQLKSHTAEMKMKQKHEFNQQKQIYENEIDSLKKSNFVLKSKISKEQKEVFESAKLSSEELVGLQKELSEQQVLLSGYQTENERLYNETKQLKTRYKVSEENFFRENQKLLIELNSLKSQLEFKENLYPPLMSQQLAMTHNFSELFSKSSNGPPILCINCNAVSKHSQLESEQVQDVYAIVKRENSILEKTKQELESQINLLIHQKEEMRQSLQEVKNGKLEEFNVIESRLKEERDEMKKKLHWYAYNQQLLDQDIAVFKQKDKEIERLNKKIEQLQSETGRRLEENKLHSKEKSAFQNRIQDLEKQVREMERIFQKRNPNSLTTLFLAAGNLEKDKASNMEESPSLVVKVLEEKVKKLESELELKENMEDKSIRSIEQKYNKLKFHYEEQIENLEQQLHHFQQKSSLEDHPHTHRLALENELESVRERHRNEKAELQVQLNQLHAAVDKLKKDEGSLHEEMKATQEQEKRIKAENQVLRKQFASSNQQVIMLRALVARLKQEKKLQQQQLHQRATSPKPESNTLDFPQKNKFKKNNPSSTQKRFLENRDLARKIKIQEEIIEENGSLKTKLDHQQLTIEQQKVELYKNKAESEAALWKIQKKHKTQIDMLKISHQQELQQIITEQTLRNSTSQIPELLSKIDAQQILINHLKEQLANTQVDGEKLSMLTIREVVLENQIKQLTDKLEEAKKTYSPDRIHFENLVNKMQDLENKHVAREKELQNIIKNGPKLQASELEKEVNKWKQIAESKNQDIENYRIELDSILNILQSFQQQSLIISRNISQHNYYPSSH